MQEINTLLTILVFALNILAVVLFYKRRSWVATLLFASYLVRAFLCILFERGGLKYIFVIDSLTFELRAWLLAQPWISADLLSALADGPVETFTYYEIFLGYIFEFFGRDTLIATLVNSLLSTLTIFLVYRVKLDFFSDEEDTAIYGCNPSAVITTIILGLYPSYLVWSATNIRDPLYFFSTLLFFYFFFSAFSPRSTTRWFGRIVSFFVCLFSFWMVLGLRSYVGNLFLAAIIMGYVLVFLLRFIPMRVFAIVSTLVPVGGAYLYQALFPASTLKILADLTRMRLNFANLRLLDSVAKSSFGLERSFSSVTDVLNFLPNALLHYFFGPFPWEITGFVQGISFLETVVIMVLAYPTLKGIKRAYVRCPTESVIILSFVVSFVVAQGMVISNMGTIFRHRSLPFLFLSIFAGEGVYELYKKSFQAFFKAEHWRALNPRRKPFRGNEPARL